MSLAIPTGGQVRLHMMWHMVQQKVQEGKEGQKEIG